MLRFFRQIRQKLITENRFSKYFFYAIGEILLIVLGIWIALQLNNWNEAYKVQLEIEQTKIDLVEELSINLNVMEFIDEISHKRAVVLDALERNDYSEEIHSIENIYGDFGIFDTFTFNLRQENLDKWIAFEKDLPEPYAELLTLAKTIKASMNERKYWENLATDLSLTRLKEMVDEHSWFYASDSQSLKQKEVYQENDPAYRNKAIHYLHFQLNENVYYTTAVRSLILTLLWRLEVSHDGKTADDWKAFMHSWGFESFDTLGCNDLPYERKDFIGHRYVTLLYNALDHAVPLVKVKEDGTSTLSFELRPKTVAPLPFNKDEFLQVNESCESIHSPVRKGYWVNE